MEITVGPVASIDVPASLRIANRGKLTLALPISSDRVPALDPDRQQRIRAIVAKDAPTLSQHSTVIAPAGQGRVPCTLGEVEGLKRRAPPMPRYLRGWISFCSIVAALPHEIE